MIFLDTNICIQFLKGEHLSIREKLLATPPKEIKIPVIVHSELLFGVRKKGIPVGPNDLLIAAMVLSHNGTLVTRNLNDFRRVDNLKIAKW